MVDLELDPARPESIIDLGFDAAVRVQLVERGIVRAPREHRLLLEQVEDALKKKKKKKKKRKKKYILSTMIFWSSWVAMKE